MFKNNLLKFFALLNFILFIYIFYKSEIFWGGSRRNFYFTYYVILFISLLLLIFLNYVNESLRKKSYILISSSIILIYLFEIALVNFSKSEIINKKLEINKNYDTRGKFQVYEELKDKENISLTITAEKKNKFRSLSGASKIKTIFCNENGDYSFFLSDRYGFNNPDNEWDKKTIDYLLLGNSFVQGACVDRPKDISSQIRKISNKTVLNLGYRNHGPLSQLATLKEYYNPRVKNVIWFYSEDNDLSILRNEIKSKILLNYLNGAFIQNLTNYQKDIDIEIRKLINKKIRDGKIKQLLDIVKLKSVRLFLYKFLPDKYQPIKKDLKFNDMFAKILIQAKNFSENNNSRFYFVYLPDFKRFNSKNYDNRNYTKIKKLLITSDIKLIDINDLVFKKANNPLIFFPYEMYGHYNELGYKKIAEKILQYIF